MLSQRQVLCKKVEGQIISLVIIKKGNKKRILFTHIIKNNFYLYFKLRENNNKNFFFENNKWNLENQNKIYKN